MTQEEIIQAIETMTVVELNELVKALQDKWGVTAMAAAAPPAAAVEDAPAAEEKTTFDVVLTSFGEKKIQVIKGVRELRPLGLKEAKELVEAAPTAVLEGVTKEEAEAAKAKLTEAGGDAEVK